MKVKHFVILSEAKNLTRMRAHIRVRSLVALWLLGMTVGWVFVLPMPAQAQEFVCCVVEDDGTSSAINFYDDQANCSDECEGECIAGTECPQESAAPPEAGGTSFDQPTTNVELPNPLRETDVAVIIGRIVRMLTGGAGMIAFLMFIYGGFQWLTAGGNPEKIKKGRDILVWSILGLVVMFSAYIVTRYIIDAITRGAGVI